MGVFKQFATNRELEKKGVPLKFSANPDGTIPTLFVKRVYRDDPAYQAAFTRITKPYKNEIDRGELDADIDARLMQRVCAETSVTGWENWRLPEGVAGGKGEGDTATVPMPDGDQRPVESQKQHNGELFDIPFSFDAVCDTFRIMPDVWRHVVATASDPDAYKVGELEEMAKNW